MKKILLHLCILLLAVCCISCEEDERESVPWWGTGTSFTFIPTDGGTVAWFCYTESEHGVIACNSTGNTWETYNGWEASNSLAEVTVTIFYPDDAFETLVIKDSGRYEYTGRTASGFTDTHRGDWKEENRCN